MAEQSKPLIWYRSKLVSRAEAKAAGLTRYFTGKPCAKGHIAQRMVSGRSCHECLSKLRDANRPKYRARWREKNPEKVREYRYVYARKNPKKHYGPNQKNNALKRYRRRKQETVFRFCTILRSRLRHAVRGDLPSATAIRLLGCTAEECVAHIESLWYRPDMTWATWGRGPNHWQIDHKRPLVSFDLTDPAQCAAACHYTNLQPLWHDEHICKTIKEHPRGRKLAKGSSPRAPLGGGK